MKNNLLLLLLACLPIGFVHAQLNMTLKSEVEYEQNLNDIWGHVADGREYALVGVYNGVSIIDVTDPENPVDLGFASGAESTWRDIKVFANYAYVINETGDGLMVIDLNNLPTPITETDYYNWEPMITGDNGIDTLKTCHNIYIDDVGYGYLSGCNFNAGGVLFVDLFSTPGSPQFVAKGAPVYSHDAYVRDNILYSSDIFAGVLSIHDVTDKENVPLLAEQATPFDFTHNSWLSKDGSVVFTTDEKPDAPVAAYDISDLTDIELIDEFRPIATIGQGVLPHNVFVWGDDWLVISYYTDGCIIADASRPDNIIEVGNFDTFLPGDNEAGSWGAYPYLPSGTVLVTDIANGLFILEPNYVRACWLEGTITDAVTGQPIFNADVDINSTISNMASSQLDGVYKTGQAISGTFDVDYMAFGYFPKTVQVTLENGIVIMQDVELDPRPTSVLGGKVVDAATNNPIANAEVMIIHQDFNYTTISDENGDFEVDNVIHDDYQIIGLIWGHLQNPLAITHNSPTTNLTVALAFGYQDDFITDLGWSVETTANTGAWVKGEPVGTFDANGGLVNPELDVVGDFGTDCYVTGNASGPAWLDDVDSGSTFLKSPPMDLTAVEHPLLRFSYWFFNEDLGGSGVAPDDDLKVIITNGQTEVTVASYDDSNPEWVDQFIIISDFLDITDSMHVIFDASDLDPTGHTYEAGIDQFLIDNMLINTNDLALQPHFTARPNPFRNELLLEYEWFGNHQNVTLQVYNPIGQLVHQQTLDKRTNKGQVELGQHWANGLYFIQLQLDGQVGKTIKVLKEQ